MNLAQQLMKLKRQLENDEKSLIRIETEKKLEVKKLQKRGLTTTKKAKEELAKWRLKRDTIQKEIRKKMYSVNELYGKFL